MKRRALIITGIVVLLLAAVFIYLNNRNRTLSPPGDSSAENAGMQLSVEYSRPSVRDRLIFGYAEEGALQPYGEYWRLGANEPTFVEVSTGFTFGDTELEAGRYALYAIPRKGEMELHLNSDLRMWGFTEPDYDADVATLIVPIGQGPQTEQFTITAEKIDKGVGLVFNWDNNEWTVPFYRN